MILEKPLRVFQIESTELDQEFSEIFIDGFSKIFKFYKPHIPQEYEDDFSLAINFILWKFSLGTSHDSTLGLEMMGLRYVNSHNPWFSYLSNLGKKKNVSLTPEMASLEIPKFKIIGVFLLNHVFPYINSKNNHSNTSSPKKILPLLKEKFSTFVSHINKFVKLLKILNFVLFLKYGKFPQLSERLLGLECRSLYPIGLSQVAYDTYHREIMWQALVDLFSTLLPSINFTKLLRITNEMTGRNVRTQTKTHTDTHTDTYNSECIQNADKEVKIHGGDNIFKIDAEKKGESNDIYTRQEDTKELIQKTGSNKDNIKNKDIVNKTNAFFNTKNLSSCVICYDWPIQPHFNTRCGHVYCFYCVHSKLLADDGYKCDACGGGVGELVLPVPAIVSY